MHIEIPEQNATVKTQENVKSQKRQEKSNIPSTYLYMYMYRYVRVRVRVYMSYVCITTRKVECSQHLSAYDMFLYTYVHACMSCVCIHMYTYAVCMYIHLCTDLHVICVYVSNTNSPTPAQYMYMYTYIYLWKCVHMSSAYIHQFVKCFPKYMHDYTYYTCMLHYTVPCVCEKLIFVSYCILPENIFSYVLYFYDTYTYNHVYYTCVT